MNTRSISVRKTKRNTQTIRHLCNLLDHISKEERIVLAAARVGAEAVNAASSHLVSCFRKHGGMNANISSNWCREGQREIGMAIAAARALREGKSIKEHLASVVFEEEVLDQESMESLFLFESVVLAFYSQIPKEPSQTDADKKP